MPADLKEKQFEVDDNDTSSEADRTSIPKRGFDAGPWVTVAQEIEGHYTAPHGLDDCTA